MDEIPKGLCQCGCGKPTLPAKYNDYKRGYVKGEPQRFYPGHYKTRKDRRKPGDRYLDPKTGYVMLYLPDHPRVHKNGRYGEHRLVMEQKLGRLLDPPEQVHHRDRNKQNNDPDNLELLPSRRAHALLHAVEEKPKKAWAPRMGIPACLRCGESERKHFCRGYCHPCYFKLYFAGELPAREGEKRGTWKRS